MNAADLQKWLAQYGAAWESRDADAAARLFSDDARYHETPFAEPFLGRDGVAQYWRKVTADQRGVRFTGEVIGVVGQTGIAHWSARFELASTGAKVELDGVFLLDFDPAAERCTRLREWWHAR